MKTVVSYCLLYQCADISEYSQEQAWEVRAHACECDAEDKNGILEKELEIQEVEFKQEFEKEALNLTR